LQTPRPGENQDAESLSGWLAPGAPGSESGTRSDSTASPRSAPAAGRLLFINQYYWPDHASTAQHLTDLAEALAAEGHEVHVLCSKRGYRPGGEAQPARETRNGVTIHRVGATSLGRRSLGRRYADYLSFYALAGARAFASPRYDAVITLTTPPLIGLLGTMLRRLRGSRHVVWSMDLHPDASLALGMMSLRNPIVRLLAWLSDHVVRSADRVIVLGDYMADRIAAKGVRPARVAMIPVWSRREEVYPLPRDGHPLREQLGLAGKFVAMYSGNIGLAHRFDEMLEAARRLRQREDIVFLFVGDGPRLGEVRAVKEAERLENVRLLDYFPREQLYASLSTADVHLISMRPEMAGIVVPGKLYGAMASGRPAIFVGPDHCETADTIREAACGRVVRPGDAAALVAAIEELAANPPECQAMGQRGRKAFLAGYERERCCRQWGRAIREVLGVRPGVLSGS
jgi:glycosyltransferase involved in cell wall biosynthesis